MELLAPSDLAAISARAASLAALYVAHSAHSLRHARGEASLATIYMLNCIVGNVVVDAA